MELKLLSIEIKQIIGKKELKVGNTTSLNLEMDMLQTHLQCWLNIWDMMLQIDMK